MQNIVRCGVIIIRENAGFFGFFKVQSLQWGRLGDRWEETCKVSPWCSGSLPHPKDIGQKIGRSIVLLFVLVDGTT